MDRNIKGGASATNDSSQSDVASQHKGRLPDDLKKVMPHKHSAVMDNKAAVLSREKLATAREDAVALREGTVTTREREIRAAETTQGTSDDTINMLRQANAHLVTATIEAHKLAEQVQMAKDQLDHLAHHDVLTDLPNRMLLQDRLCQAGGLARRPGRQMAGVFLARDRF